MGFLQEIKVPLNTRSADQVGPGYSYGKWVLKDNIAPPNPNYKIKITVQNVVIPSSYEKVGPERGNHIMTLGWNDAGHLGESAAQMIAGSRYVTLELPNPLANSRSDHFMLSLRQAFFNTFQGTGIAPVAIKEMQYKPWPVFDGDTGDESIFPTIGIAAVDYAALNGASADSPIRRFLGYPIISDTSLLPVTLTDSSGFEWRVFTEADITGTALDNSKVAMSHVCGFVDNQTYPSFKFFPGTDPARTLALAREEGPDYTHSWTELDTSAIGGCVRATRRPDLMGTRFIKVFTNLPISNMDPNEKALRNMLGVIPVTDGDGLTEVAYLSGQLQSPQYNTLAQTKLDTIELRLLDDKDNPLRPHADWYLEFSVMFEEPALIDAYRGISDLTGNPETVRFGASANPAAYARMQNELKRTIIELEDFENDNRASQAGRIRSR